MSDEPEALRLADALFDAAYSMPADERGWYEDANVGHVPHNVCTAAATELRRLHAENEAHRTFCGEIFKALGTSDADRTQWPAEIKRLRKAARMALDAMAGYRREMWLASGVSYQQPCDAERALREALGGGGRAMTECNCSMRTKLVGDGCAVCNPALARDMELDELREAARAALDACQRVIHECDPGPDPKDVRMFADAYWALMALREALGDKDE